jgi:hypothetical protein
MRKILALLIGFIIYFNCLSCKRELHNDTFSFDKVYYYAIQEDVKRIVESINSFNEDSLTNDQKELKRKYNSRFLFRSEKFNFNTTDTVLIKILTVFQNYWAESLMKETSLRRADEKYKILLSNLLISINYSSNRGINQEINRFDFEKALRNLLKEKGCFARIDRTGNIMDLIIWSGQRVKTYDVKIEDTILKVPVVLIDSVISYGWEGFATFNSFYPGGWTSPDTLFCITKDYDLNSEKFLVSYLTHETQHLFDSKKYRGGNPTWMEEYRAKLAELSVADSTVHNLLSGFIKGFKKDPKLPHPYAEYMVIKGLSKDLLKTDFVTDLNEWKKVPNTEINLASRRLLKENSHTLKLK